jgi:hypothetical protein
MLMRQWNDRYNAAAAARVAILGVALLVAPIELRVRGQSRASSKRVGRGDFCLLHHANIVRPDKKER